MARPPKNKSTAPGPMPPTLKVWLEEAWHGWLKPVAAILVLLGAYFAYDRGLVPEGSAGLVVVALIIGGTIVSAAMPIFPLLERRQSKLLLGVFMVIWAIGAGYPSLRRAFPSKAIGEPLQIAFCARYKDADKRECAEPTLTATVDLKGGGPYEVAVSGELKGAGEVQSNYHLTFAGADNSSEEIEGNLKRTFFHQRTSRRSAGGTMVKTEHTENSHRLSVPGDKLTITADGVDEVLENGLTLTFHHAGPDPRIFLGITLLCVLLGVWLDYRLSEPKVKTYFALAAGLTLVFAWYYPEEATPHNLVRPAIAALVAALLGALGGWLLSVIIKSFKPKPKRAVK
jgi:hypothetical protein